MTTTILAVLGVIILALFAMQLVLRMRMQAMQGKPAPELKGEWGKAIRKGRRALFYFYSPHCGPCKAMAPTIDALAADHPRVFKVDVSQDFGVARKFGVMATPAVVLVENGVIQRFLIGRQGKEKLQELLAAPEPTARDT